MNQPATTSIQVQPGMAPITPWNPRPNKTPIVKRENRRLCQSVRINGGSFYFEFDVPVAWVRSSVSRIELRHANLLVEQLETHNDHYGFLTSAESAVRASNRFIKKYGLSNGDKLRVVVVVSIIDTPQWVDITRVSTEHGRLMVTEFPREWDAISRDGQGALVFEPLGSQSVFSMACFDSSESPTLELSPASIEWLAAQMKEAEALSAEVFK